MADDEDLKRDTLLAYDGAIATAVAAGLAGPAALALPLLPVFLGLADRAVRHRIRRRWATWLLEYLQDSGTHDPEIVEAKLHAESDDPVAQELVDENARLIAEALADSAVPDRIDVN